MKSIIYILIIFIFLGLYNVFGKVEYILMPQKQTVDLKTKSTVLSAFGKMPLHFVANQGQLDPSIVYYAKSEGANVYCTEEGLVFGFAERNIHLKFSEDKRFSPEARGELPGKVNHFIGNNAASWQTNIPTYSEVIYLDVYPGIDLVYSGDQRRLKYTFYLQPDSDPNQIQMIYDGIDSLWVDKAIGELVIQTEWASQMRDAAPVAYQEIEGIRKEINISFRLMGEKCVGFALGDYDPDYMLVLDPGYSTYLGGQGFDYGHDITVDTEGNVYVTGVTFSSNFPTQIPYQGSSAGNNDAFVTKISSNGKTLIYSTYLGGYSVDNGHDITVDSEGNVYVTGITFSSNFPTKNPYQGGNAGINDAFVTKLSSSGNTLIYSTYLGGSDSDTGDGIAVDGSGNAYVTGYTISSNFPTQHPYQGSNAGNTDAFVTKFSSSGNMLIYSTYLGGNGFDFGSGIALDNSGNAYVTGKTESSNFPTQNPYQSIFGGGDSDAFVTKLSTSGNTLIYSTYLGGSGNYEEGYDIAVNNSGNAHVTGRTSSLNFPTQNPYQGSNAGGRDAFVTKLSSIGNTLIYSTYLGGSGVYETGLGIAVDGSGNAYVTGYTNSSDFPTQNPYQGSNAGIYDAFVTKLSSIGNTLIYSTYLGGSSRDYGFGIAVDNSGNAYVTGETGSLNFPTLNPYQSSNAGDYDAFVTSFLLPGNVPVELSLLTASVSADGVTIRWRTESETNNIGFEVERGQEQTHFNKVGFVQGKGTTTMPQSYTFIDGDISPGIYYYRLKQIDTDGTIEYSKTIKVIVSAPRSFSLEPNYPNPFNPITVIKYQLANPSKVILKIYNLLGQEVKTLVDEEKNAGYHSVTWDGKDNLGRSVDSGIYTYQIGAGDFVQTRKMVLIR